MKERWSRWNPVEDLEEEYEIESIVYTSSGIEIIVYDVSPGFFCHKIVRQKIKIVFDKGPISFYRYADESFRQTLINFLAQEYRVHFYAYWAFFKVENSSYIQSLPKEYQSSLRHFSFLLRNSVIDIVATYEPHVEEIQKGVICESNG